MRTYLALLVAIATLVGSTALMYGFLWSADRAQADAADQMAYRAERAARVIADGVAMTEEQTQTLAAQPGLADLFAHADRCPLSSGGMGGFSEVRLGIVSVEGDEVCSSNPAALRTPRLHADSPWLTEVLGAAGPVVVWDATDQLTQERTLVVGTPLTADGRVAGAVVGFVGVEHVAVSLKSEMLPSDHGALTVVDRESREVISSSLPDATAGNGAGYPDVGGTGVREGLDGTERIFTRHPVSGGEWWVYAGADRAAVLEDARGAVTRQALVVLVALVVLGPILWVLSRRITRPLAALTDGVRRAGRDPLAPRVPEGGTAEMAALAREFNAMLRLRAGYDAKLVYQATHDVLTGLPNKALFRDRLVQALGGDQPVAILCVGIPRIKKLRHGLGHDAVDRALVETAERLTSQMRSHDTVACFADDEFMMLATGAREDAEALAQRLRRGLSAPLSGPGAMVAPDPAIGISISGPSRASSAQLIHQAHTAMSHSRNQGEDWVVFDDIAHLDGTDHLDLERDLMQALERGELTVHYQPIVDVMTGRTLGTEALVRWQHPTRGLVPPLEFIPIAEEAGHICAIGLFVLRQACEQTAAWAAAGHPLRISVNVAVEQLRDESFPEAVRQVLDETGLDPGNLCLEVTESTLMRKPEQTAASLARLREMGVHVAIDDFGTGYSSLSYLHHLPVDVLKIDRAFVARIEQEQRDRNLLQAIVGMAQTLGLTIVAEGVENEHQRTVLAQLGCEQAQGYWFARPAPADEMSVLLDAEQLAQLR